MTEDTKNYFEQYYGVNWNNYEPVKDDYPTYKR